MQTPHSILDNKHRLPSLTPNFSTYCLGWNSRDYKGLKLVSHTGGLWGSVSQVILAPQIGFGVVVLTNQEIGHVFDVICYTILNHFMDKKSIKELEEKTTCDLLKEGVESWKLFELGAHAAENQYKSARRLNTKPSLELSEYVGTYTDVWYGNVYISKVEKGLEITFSNTPKLKGILSHWHLDTFVAEWYIRELNADAFVTFGIKSDGVIETMKMKPTSPLVDFSFNYKDLHLVKKNISQ